MIAVQLLLARAALDHNPLLVQLSLGSLIVPLVLLIVAQLRHRGVVERFIADRVSRQFVRHMTLAAYVVWTCCLGLALTQS